MHDPASNNITCPFGDIPLTGILDWSLNRLTVFFLLRFIHSQICGKMFRIVFLAKFFLFLQNQSNLFLNAFKLTFDILNIYIMF